MESSTRAGLSAQQVIDQFVQGTAPPTDLVTRSIVLASLLEQKVNELKLRGVSESAIYRDPTVISLYGQLLQALTAIGEHPVALRDVIGEVEQELHQEPPRTYDDDGLPIWVPLALGAVTYAGLSKHGGGKMADGVPLEVPKEHLPGKLTEDITRQTLKSVDNILLSRKAQITLALVETVKVRAQSVAKQTGKSLKWVAELDSSTCRACLAMHGRIFEAGETVPRGHVNCRCVLVTVKEGTIYSDKEAMAYLKKRTPEERKRILGSTGAQKFSEDSLNLKGAYRIKEIEGTPTLMQGKASEL